MTDYFEVDFLGVETKDSGDAITVRYRLDGVTYIHVVDGGYQETGKAVVDHIRKYYDSPTYIDYVVVTHPDGDHAGGLRSVLESFAVGELWMLRPWKYADELIDRFSNYTSVERLRQRLRSVYPNLAALEEIALAKGIPIQEPFQGADIGAFRVLAPTKLRYLDLIVSSERTPEAESRVQMSSLGNVLMGLGETAVRHVAALLKWAAWGEELFSPGETSAENEMSVVQYAALCGTRIVLTADTGRTGLAEAADYAPLAGLALPGVDRIQVPHHGSRRNVSTEVLDRWLGARLPNPPSPGAESFIAFISSAKADPDHPRKSVIRAFIHRGGKVVATEGQSIRTQGGNAPARAGWSPVTSLDYPQEQEDD